MSFKNRLTKCLILIVAVVLMALSRLTPEEAPPTDTTFDTYSGGLSVIFIDVGQGDSTLIQTKDGTSLLVDGGEYEMYEESLLPTLQKQGINRLDYVLASHYHSDHMGALVPLVEDGMAENLLIPNHTPENSHKTKLERAAKKTNTAICELTRGDKIELKDENLSIEVLNPPTGGFADDENSSSVVLKITYFKTTLLLTGDIEKEAEIDLAKKFDLECDILKVAHHGSTTSSCANFLQEANPTHAVIQCGKDNRYGHPHYETLDALENDDVQIWRCDTDGSIAFFIGEKGIEEIKTHY